MSIGFVCEHCGQKLTVSSSRAGQRGNCPKCRKLVVVPGPARDSPAVTAANATAKSDAQPNVSVAKPPPAATNAPAKNPLAKSAPPAPTTPSTTTTSTPPNPSPIKPLPAATAPSNVAVSAPVEPRGPAPAPVATSPPADEPPPPPVPPSPIVVAPVTDEAPQVVEPPLSAPQPVADELPAWIAQSEREESPWIYVDAAAPVAPEQAKPQVIDLSKVSIPRYVVFAQGIALGVVALVAFALGLLAGGASRSTNVGPVAGAMPCVVTGKVEQVTSGGTKFPDEGAVVILFPQDQRPATEERAQSAGLRPDDPPPNPAIPGLQMLQLMGAVHTRTDVAGQFRVTLPRGGKYYLLVVSHHASRRKGRDIGRADLAAMGRYLTSAMDLVGDRRYRWRVEEFERDAEILVVLD